MLNFHKILLLPLMMMMIIIG